LNYLESWTETESGTSVVKRSANSPVCKSCKSFLPQHNYETLTRNWHEHPSILSPVLRGSCELIASRVVLVTTHHSLPEVSWLPRLGWWQDTHPPMILKSDLIGNSSFPVFCLIFLGIELSRSWRPAVLRKYANMDGLTRKSSKLFQSWYTRASWRKGAWGDPPGASPGLCSPVSTTNQCPCLNLCCNYCTVL